MGKHSFLSASASHRWINCPFFKTTAQCDADRQKSYERLVSIGRDDLIERYQVRGVYGS